MDKIVVVTLCQSIAILCLSTILFDCAFAHSSTNKSTEYLNLELLNLSGFEKKRD